MDAYSYLVRGHVFANAQTGNIILLGVNLANGDISVASRYLLPILAFTLGIIISDMINRRKSFIKIHWRQISVLIEAIILLIVAFLPYSQNSFANIITSLACGIQLETFRKIHGNVVATTMCIGNLRSGTYNMENYIKTNEKDFLRRALIYYGVIIAFVIGAVIESFLVKSTGRQGILLSTFALIIAFILMFQDNSKSEKVKNLN